MTPGDLTWTRVLAFRAVRQTLGQRARALQPDDPEQWRLHAATTLLSGMVVRSVEG